MRYEQYLLTEDAKTEFYETASMIGVLCSDREAANALSIIKNYKEAEGGDITDTLSSLVKYLDKKHDWSPSGKEQIKSLLVDGVADFGNIDRIIDLFSLVAGMNDYMREVGKSVVGNKADFIHNRINDYYKIEKEVLGEIPGTKANTADCIIANASPDKVLSAFKKGMPTPDKELKYINLPGGIKLLQVSLKKSEKGAQLGKITSFLKTNLQYGADTATATKALTETQCYGFISESIWDRVKAFASTVWDKVKSAVKKAMSSFIGKWMGIFKGNPPDRYVKQFFTEIGMSGNLTEGKINAPTQAVIDSMSKNPGKAVKIINTLIKQLQNTGDGDETIAVISSMLTPMKKFSGDPNAGTFTLISNYLTLRTLLDMAKDEKGVAAVVNRLIAEMLFGGTKLPLWKVYGNYGDGHSYVYLGTMDVFMQENKPKPKIEILGVKIKPQKDFYTITVLMLNEVSDKGKTYFVLRTGTNSSSRITFIFEGTKVSKEYPLDMDLKKILSGKI